MPTGLSALFTPVGERDTRRPSGPRLRLPGDIGTWLGHIERHEYALALRGEKGAGKTRLLFQLMDAFAAVGLNVGAFSLEIDKNSDLITKMRDAYIKPDNHSRIVVASEAPRGVNTLREAAKAFDVVAIDSYGKVPGIKPEDFDKLRKEFPATIWLVIFQSTTAGTARGGSAVEYDAAAVAQVIVPGVAYFEKNRYAEGPADELKYLVMEQRLQ